MGNREITMIVVCFPFIGDVLGGSHVSAAGLIRNLDRSRYQPLVVLHDIEGPVAAYFRKENIAFEQAPVRNQLQRLQLRNFGAVMKVARSLPSLVSFLKSKRVNIVHTNDGRSHVVWGLAARIAGARLLWHHRSDNASIGLHLLAPILANRVACVSKFAAPKPGFYSAASKATVIFSPFDVEKSERFDRLQSRNMVLAETGAAPDTHLLGFVGNLVDRKRPLVFLQTIAELRNLAPGSRFMGLYLGSSLGEMEQRVNAKASELGVSEFIRFLGYRHPGEAWIAGFDALLVPSVGEPLGRTMVEAMLLGTPVIAANSGGNPEAIETHTGILVPPDDPIAMAKAYLDLSRSPQERGRVVEAAKRMCSEKFSTARHIYAVSRLYDQMIASRGLISSYG
jgi:glycosyltransferase involved in cell wall biosynthesis